MKPKNQEKQEYNGFVNNKIVSKSDNIETAQKEGIFTRIVTNIRKILFRFFIIINIFVSIWLFESFGFKGIIYSALITSVLIIIFIWDLYVAQVKEGFKLLWGKYPHEIQKGEKLRKVKIVFRGKKNVK